MKPKESTIERDGSAVLFLVLSTALAYSRLLGNAFINLDDPLQLLSNERVLSGLSWGNVLWSFGPESPCSPVTWLAYAAIHATFGLQPWAYHVASLVLHMASAVILYLFLRSSTGEYLKSAFVASLFALHPINVESVAWVAELNNVLSGLFFMLTLGLYAWYARRPGPVRYLVTIATFGLGLLAKPVLMTLPFILLLVDLWPLRRIRVTGDAGMSLVRLVGEKVPFMLMALVSIVSTLLTVKEHASFYSTDTVPILLRLSNALVSCMKYLGKLFWPTDLALLYPYPAAVPWWQTAGAGFVMLLMTITALKVMRRRPYVLTGWLWFLGGLVPFLGIVQAGQWPEMADRYAYLTSIGIFLTLAWGIPELAGRLGLPRWVSTAAGVCVILVLMALSWLQVGHWKDSVTLFTHVLSINPGNPVSHNSLANGLNEQGQTQEAISQYHQALQINPSYHDALFNLGLAYQGSGRLEDARRYLEKALKVDSSHPDAHAALGSVLADMGLKEEAVHHLQESLRLNPTSAEALTAMGNILLRAGRFDEAAKHYSLVLQRHPDKPEVLNNLGTAFVGRGDMEQAVSYFEEALRISPDFPDARQNLERARALLHEGEQSLKALLDDLEKRPRDPELLTRVGDHYARHGKAQEALARYSDALSVRPDHVPALFGKALVMVSKQDYEDALEVFLLMRKIQPGNPKIPYNIACLYARQNDVKEAIGWLEETMNKGFRDRKLLIEDPDLGPIRDTEGFKRILRLMDGSRTKK